MLLALPAASSLTFWFLHFLFLWFGLRLVLSNHFEFMESVSFRINRDKFFVFCDLVFLSVHKVTVLPDAKVEGVGFFTVNRGYIIFEHNGRKLFTGKKSFDPACLAVQDHIAGISLLKDHT